VQLWIYNQENIWRWVLSLYGITHTQTFTALVTTRRFIYRCTEHYGYHVMTRQMQAVCRLRLKCDGTRAETRFRLSAKRTSPFKSAGASVQSTTGSRGVRISGSNSGYTMFRGSVKGIGYALHSPVSPSLPLPCVTVCHHIPNGFYTNLLLSMWRWQRRLDVFHQVYSYKILRSAHTVYLCKKKWLFSYTALTDWLLITGKRSVYSAVRAESLNIWQVNFSR